MPDFDLLTAGFPCQPFSTYGQCKGFEDCRSDIFQYLIEIIKLKNPQYVLFENTATLLNHDNGATLWKILQALWENGYNAQWQVIDSHHFIAQNRRRIYIIASLAKESTPAIFPLPYFSQTNPQAAQRRTRSKSMYPEEERSKPRSKKEIQQSISKGEYWFLNTGFLKSHKTNRLRLRRATPTITTNPSSEFMVIQNGNARILTPQECEKLQGFPSGFTASVSADSRRYNLIGNAVTIPVIEMIGKVMMRECTV